MIYLFLPAWRDWLVRDIAAQARDWNTRLIATKHGNIRLAPLSDTRHVQQPKGAA